VHVIDTSSNELLHDIPVSGCVAGEI